jgi:hypothetical protein
MSLHLFDKANALYQLTQLGGGDRGWHIGAEHLPAEGNVHFEHLDA